MAVSRALRRLMRIRELEEEQCRMALESATGELGRMQHALSVGVERDRMGRRLVDVSARTGELRDRLAGLEETRTAVRLVEILEPRIAAAEVEVARLWQEFLGKRLERRQAETLIREIEAADAVESGRRSQQALDDWFRSRLHGTRAQTERDMARSIGTEPKLNQKEAEKT